MSAVRAFVTFLSLLCVIFVFTACQTAAEKPAGQADHAAGGGLVAKGKTLFEDAKLGGGTSGKSCASCHPGGKGLEGIAEKTEYRAMGRTYTSLESITNYFIVTAQLGKGLDPQSEEMQALVAYMKSLKR
jgi:cytochrome c